MLEYLIPVYLSYRFMMYSIFSMTTVADIPPAPINISMYNMKLALQKCNTSDDWSIHGLWLDYANGSYPEFCSKLNFDNLSYTLEKDMNSKWYSCEGDDYTFWNHELQKHASCIKDYIMPDLNSNDYFNYTMGLYNGFHPLMDVMCTNNTQCFITLT